MRLYSAALGMTLDSDLVSLTPSEEQDDLVLKVDSTSPLPMQFVCTMQPRDLRTLGRMASRPAVMARVLRMTLRSFRDKREGQLAPHPVMARRPR